MHHPTQSYGGIYVHIPFCRKKCPYCDFYSQSDMSKKSAYVTALMREIQNGPDPGVDFDTLYFGGGTPSLLTVREVADLIATISQTYQVLEDMEITLEVNPGTLSKEKLKGYRAAGVNRLNIGVQSFDDRNLRFLERIHSAADASMAMADARRAGFENIGLDLIYGLPGQSMQNWEFELRQAVLYHPEHLACYMLTYETGTPMQQRLAKGCLRPLPEDRVAQQFRHTRRFLIDSGYLHYEISNYAVSKKRRSRHNMKYWTFAPYIGFGASAHSFVAPRRWWNRADVGQYISDMSSGRPVMEDVEVLTREQALMETIYVGLRRAEGIDMDSFENEFQTGFQKRFGIPMKHLEKKGLVQIQGKRFAVTERGMLFLDSIVDALITAEPGA